jgi:hypothetical protein
MHEKHEHKHVLFVPFVFFVDHAFGRFITVNHLRTLGILLNAILTLFL